MQVFPRKWAGTLDKGLHYTRQGTVDSNLSRTAAPLWAQTTQIPTTSSLKAGLHFQKGQETAERRNGRQSRELLRSIPHSTIWTDRYPFPYTTHILIVLSIGRIF